MTTLDPQVTQGILELLAEAQGDWEYTGEIGPDTRFVADLGLESLEIVVLSTMVQQRYGRLPFPQFFDEIGQRPVDERDLTVADLAMFVCEHRQPTHLEV
jgi:acyl carrier protein